MTLGQTELEFQCPESRLAATAQTDKIKRVLLLQSSKLQGQIWREALVSQGIALTWLNPDVNLKSYLNQQAQASQGWPHLLLLDMTVLQPNAYSFCRWCRDAHPALKIVLTSGTRTSVPSSERKWAKHQGAVTLLPAFPATGLFTNLVDIVTKVKVVLQALEWQPVEQQSLSSALMSIRSLLHQNAQA